MKFSRKTIEGIKFYVYGLRYPGKKQYFYIGKGKGNRVFSHIKQKNRQGIKDPKFDIIESLQEFGGPEIDIIRHGLEEKDALLLEAALIDVLGVKQIANKVRGIDSDRFGLMSPRDVEANFKGLEFNLKIPAVCFKINKKWKKNISEQDLYEVVRKRWYLSVKRASNAKYAIGVCYGVIRAIYEIERWENTEISNRYAFTGFKAESLQKFVGYTMHNHPGHKVRGPLFYNYC